MFGCHSRLVVFSVIGLFSALDMSAEVLSKRSWREAAQSCTLLGSSNTGEVHIEKINISSEVKDALYWIGAIVSNTLWFQVLGSAQVTGLGEKVDQPYVLSCHLYCNSNGQKATYYALMVRNRGYQLRNKLKARRSSKVSFHNKNYEVGMEGVNIPPLYAEVEECVNSTDKTPQGNPRDSGGSDRTYDHARVQSLGRILTDDDYDHLQ
nr:uncharacterized protein LOC105328511 [Crassostrea gigas]